MLCCLLYASCMHVKICMYFALQLVEFNKVNIYHQSVAVAVHYRNASHQMMNTYLPENRIMPPYAFSSCQLILRKSSLHHFKSTLRSTRRCLHTRTRLPQRWITNVYINYELKTEPPFTLLEPVINKTTTGATVRVSLTWCALILSLFMLATARSEWNNPRWGWYLKHSALDARAGGGINHVDKATACLIVWRRFYVNP